MAPIESPTKRPLLTWNIVTAGLGILTASLGGALSGIVVDASTAHHTVDLPGFLAAIAVCVIGLTLFVGGAVSAALSSMDESADLAE